jgi:hypothetical protein
VRQLVDILSELQADDEDDDGPTANQQSANPE